VFLTEDPPDPGAMPTSLILGVDAMTAPELQQAFAIGSSLEHITVPAGTTRLFLGHNDGYEWINNVGSLEVTVTTMVSIDIKPGSCPNPINTKSKGVLPVAILGTEVLDVGMIDPASIRLAGVAPIRSSYEDVATPLGDELDDCECTTEGPDGYLDLTLKFKTQEIIAALGEVNDGDAISLALTGQTDDDAHIQGSDCVVILKKGDNGKK